MGSDVVECNAYPFPLRIDPNGISAYSMWTSSRPWHVAYRWSADRVHSLHSALISYTFARGSGRVLSTCHGRDVMFVSLSLSLFPNILFQIISLWA